MQLKNDQKTSVCTSQRKIPTNLMNACLLIPVDHQGNENVSDKNTITYTQQ